MLDRAQYIAARSHNPENVESAVQDQIEVPNMATRPSLRAVPSFTRREPERRSYTASDGRMYMCDGAVMEGSLRSTNHYESETKDA